MRFDNLDNATYELLAGPADLASLVALCCCQHGLRRRLLAIAAIWRRKRGELLTAIVMAKSPAEIRLLEQLYGDGMRWATPLIPERVLLPGACIAGELWKVRWVVGRFGHLWAGRCPVDAFVGACEHDRLEVAKWLFAACPPGQVTVGQALVLKVSDGVAQWLVADVITRECSLAVIAHLCSVRRYDVVKCIAERYGLKRSYMAVSDLENVFAECDLGGAEMMAGLLDVTPGLARTLAPRVEMLGNPAVSGWLAQFEPKRGRAQ